MKKILRVFISILLFTSCSNHEVREIKDPISGQLMEQFEIYETDEGSFLKDGFFKKWFSNGQIKTCGEYTDNKQSGEWRKYYKNGQLKSSSTWENGFVNGPLTTYFENGTKQSEGYYTMQKCNGVCKSWYENGQLKAIQNYQNDNLDGAKTIYYLNGNKKSEITYSKGIKEGLAVYWHDNGQKKSKGKYSNNVKSGNEWTYWDNNGIEYLNKNEIIIGTWKDENSTTTYTTDHKCTTIWENGTKKTFKWVIKNNKLHKSNGYWSSSSSTFVSFENNSFNTKDSNGKIWHNNRVK